VLLSSQHSYILNIKVKSIATAMENISYASTCEESATDAKAVKAPS